MSQQEQLSRLSEILNSPTSEESSEQNEFSETLKKIPADVVLLILSKLLQNFIVITR